MMVLALYIRYNESGNLPTNNLDLLKGEIQ
jgi:hypothetical protein